MNKFLLKIFFAVAVLTAVNAHAQNWDINLLKSINSQSSNGGAWVAVTKSTYPVAVAVPVGTFAVGYFSKNKLLQKKAIDIAGSLVINVAITQSLKYIINRQRPYQKYPGEVFPYQYDTDPSFPSGHTSTAFATATSLSLNCKKWYVVAPAFVWATAVGYSRLHMGEHYPSDVLMGAVIGAGSAWLSHWLTEKYFAKHKF